MQGTEHLKELQEHAMRSRRQLLNAVVVLLKRETKLSTIKPDRNSIQAVEHMFAASSFLGHQTAAEVDVVKVARLCHAAHHLMDGIEDLDEGSCCYRMLFTEITKEERDSFNATNLHHDDTDDDDEEEPS